MKNIVKRSVVAFLSAVIVFSSSFGAFHSHAESGSATVYLTKTGDCYHIDGCTFLSRSKIPTTLQSAVSRGFSPCSKCHAPSLSSSGSVPSSAPATGYSYASAPSSGTKSLTGAAGNVSVMSAIEALKYYKGNSAVFNAYYYYMYNPDLQIAIGPNGDALMKHYLSNGIKEGRKAVAK